MSESVPAVLTIAGLDPSCGAGVTADLAVFAVHGLFGVCAVSVWTVQSTQGVAATRPADADFFAHTLAHLTSDVTLSGVKIGALGSVEVAAAVADFVQEELQGEREKLLTRIVLDPVVDSSSGASLFPRSGLGLLHQRMLPSVGWITPNWRELELLSGLRVSTMVEAEAAATAVGHRHPHLNIVVTGGDQREPVDLLRTAEGGLFHFAGEHVSSRSTHGTGCAFSSALLSNLILGRSPQEAVLDAKLYVAEGIRRAPVVGKGRGPLDLYWPLRPA